MGLVQMVMAKGIVVSAFRNGPLEDIHADGRISQAEMKTLMKFAVDHVAALLQMWFDEPEVFGAYMTCLMQMTFDWDEPANEKKIRDDIRELMRLSSKSARSET